MLFESTPHSTRLKVTLPISRRVHQNIFKVTVVLEPQFPEKNCTHKNFKSYTHNLDFNEI